MLRKHSDLCYNKFMKNIFRIFSYTKPWTKHLAAATVGLFLALAVNLTAPAIIRRIIVIMEGTQLEAYQNHIIVLALVLLGLFLVRAFGQFLNWYFAHIASWNMVSQIRQKLYNHMQKLSMGFYHNKQTGELLSRIVNDTMQFENMLAHAIPEMITNALTIIGVLAILLFISPLLTLLILIPIPLMFILRGLIKKMRSHFRRGQKELAALSAVLQDNISGMREIQVFNKQEFEAGRVKEKADNHANNIIKALFRVGVLNPTVLFITSIGTIIVLIAGPNLSLTTSFQISDLVAFLLYINMFYAPITNLARLIEDIQHGLVGAERVFEVLDTQSEVKDREGATDISNAKGEIEFKNVTFSYEDNITVLNDISFKVGHGQTLALVGPTGVGKSTIGALVARFYDPTSGKILLDGKDTKDITVKSLRDQLSIVLQDVFLFNGTIADNIAYGSKDASREQIKYAAEIACISEFIESLPDGYDTLIGERGVRLSGGQKQRLSIARSVLREAPILILDEATSAVDTETERDIQLALDKIAGTRTIIVIAHRLSTIRKADIIIVLNKGKIAEMGNHKELMEQNGIYKNLYKVYE